MEGHKLNKQSAVKGKSDLWTESWLQISETLINTFHKF